MEYSQYKEMLEHLESKNKPICPRCKSKKNVLHCFYGKPNSTLLALQTNKKVILKGCCIGLKKAIGYCTKCSNDIWEK